MFLLLLVQPRFVTDLRFLNLALVLDTIIENREQGFALVVAGQFPLSAM